MTKEQISCSDSVSPSEGPFCDSMKVSSAHMELSVFPGSMDLLELNLLEAGNEPVTVFIKHYFVMLKAKAKAKG